jgi:hypothetical protein
MARVRFVESTLFEGVSYAKNQVVDLSDKAIRALGDSVEAADDRDVEEENRNVADADPDARTEHTVTREPDDAQDIPDAVRDNDAEEGVAPTTEKSIDQPGVNKMVNKPSKKK